MEALFISLARDYGTAGVALLVLFIFHRQGVSELKKISTSQKETNEKLTEFSSTLAVHAVKLESIEDMKRWNEKQDEKIHNLSNKVHKVSNESVTHKHLQTILEALDK